MNLGERIYKLRTEKEMSQGDLAEAMEVSRQSISKWETNGSVPELEKLVKLSEVFDITLDELVMGENISERPVPEPQVIYIEKPVARRRSKTQKWCIAVCSLVCVLLLANLFTMILLPEHQSDHQPSNGPTGSGPVQQVPQDFEIVASEVNGMEIEWSAGSVTIMTADTDQITVAAPNSAELVGDVLKILTSADSAKELVITVPKDWNCQNMKLQCTGMTISIMGISVGSLELSGADCALTISGSLENLNITGNRCTLDLTLPKDRGFQVEVDRIHNTFQSDLLGIRFEGNKYTFGDQYCKIKVEGMSCEIFVNQSK